MYVPINIAGGSYEHRSRPLSSQTTKNFWPQLQEDSGTSQYILESTPGLTSFSSGSGTDRGIFNHLGVLYKVTGTTLSSINSAGSRTTIGTIPGTSRCVFASVSTILVVVSDGVAYSWNGVTLTTGTDVDFETPQTVTVLNTQAIYDGDAGRFCTADVGDPLSINALNYATAEAISDTLVRPYAFNQVAYMFCQKHIESWWNSGTGNPPFDRLEGGLYEVGLGAVYSTAHNKSALYFFGSDRNVHRIGAGGLESNFTPKPLIREFTNYATVSDAIGWTMNYQGQEFYLLKFPTANKTFAYPEGGQWFEWSSSVYDDYALSGRYAGNGYAYCYGKHLLSDEDGNVLELDEDTYTDNSGTIKRVRDTSPIHGGLVAQPGKNITLTRFKLLLETGVGASGSDPQVMLSFSTDGGRTFGTEVWGDVGVIGDYLTPVEWSGINVSGESVIVRIQVSDPYYASLHSAGAEIEVGIWALLTRLP